MTTCLSSQATRSIGEVSESLNSATGAANVGVALLTGGFDKPYVSGLAMALTSKGICVDVVGGDDVDGPEMHTTPKLTFLNLKGAKRDNSLYSKVSRVLMYYARLVRYAALAKPEVFHILWNNKFETFDRTLLMMYYRLLGKKIVFTAHNVNAGKRDSNDSLLNRLTLKAQYKLTDHIFVHTEKMRGQLIHEFGIRGEAISVVPFGINNSVPNTDLNSPEAKRHLGIEANEKTILFFGAIRAYKGLEHMVEAFLWLVIKDPEYRLIIAGESRKGSEKYLAEILRMVDRSVNRERVIQKIQYIPDSETEIYFKAADVLVLPYAHVFQSGVLFLAYGFGLPVIATDVGSFREEVIDGMTGFLSRSCDPTDLARTVEKYFGSDLYVNLTNRRLDIQVYANAKHSWHTVGTMTQKIYWNLLGIDKS
jgi:D-inositol-3-phosphate glycosyltransferase